MVGIGQYVTIDGTDVGLNPTSVTVDPTPEQTIVSTLSGRRIVFSNYHGAGFPDRVASLDFSIPWGSIEDNNSDALRTFLDEISSTSVHTLALWLPETLTYTCTASQTTFYLPHGRSDGPVTLGKSTIAFPVTVTDNGTPLTVVRKTYADFTGGTPAAGEWWISDGADGSGYVPMKVLARTAGHIIRVTYFPCYVVILSDEARTYPQTISEGRTLHFTER